jgi:hypothetical protein
MNNSNIIAFLAKEIPGLLSKESINDLVSKNDISYDAAMESLNFITADFGKEAKDGGVKTDDDLLAKHAKFGFLSSAKFKAELESSRQDERLLFEEFIRVDAARDALIAKISERQEALINNVLHHLKTVSGVDQGIVDDMLGLRLKAQSVS